MVRPQGTKTKGKDAPIGFEAQLWSAADTLRGNVDASEYKHVVLGLLFLKYISDAFEELHTKLQQEPGADPEDRDEYLAENVFWVPVEARWSKLQGDARQSTIGTTVDNAMLAIERENQSLRGVLPRDYGREALDKRRLGELVDLVANISVGDSASRSKDVLGRVYEYFLGRFAALEGRGRESSIRQPTSCACWWPCWSPSRAGCLTPAAGPAACSCSRSGSLRNTAAPGPTSRCWARSPGNTTWKLCKMNLAIRGIEADIRWNGQGSFLRDEFPDLKADFIMANPPFNDSEWGGQLLRSDVRWRYGPPPVGNSNYGWIQHFIHHLSNSGTAGFVLANGSLSVGGVEGEIRKGIIEDDLVDCIVSLPGQLFYSTQIPVSLWFISRNRSNRSGRTLFIDAREIGEMADRTHRVLTDADIERVAGTYHVWRSGADAGSYEDIAGFCKNASLDEIRGQGHVLTPGRYVGVGEVEDDGEPFEEKMQRLVTTLREQQEEGKRLDKAISENLEVLGYGG